MRWSSTVTSSPSSGHPRPHSADVPTDSHVPADGSRPDSGAVFTDVPPGASFYREISWLADSGVTTGWIDADGTKTYRPAQQVNRDQMAAFIYRQAGSPAYMLESRFSFVDILTNHTFYKQISWLDTTGISNGWTEPDTSKTYRAGASILRDQMAAFMYRYISQD